MANPRKRSHLSYRDRLQRFKERGVAVIPEDYEHRRQHRFRDCYNMSAEACAWRLLNHAMLEFVESNGQQALFDQYGLNEHGKLAVYYELEMILYRLKIKEAHIYAYCKKRSHWGGITDRPWHLPADLRGLENVPNVQLFDRTVTWFGDRRKQHEEAGGTDG
jgi:hypothetical protein